MTKLKFKKLIFFVLCTIMICAPFLCNKNDVYAAQSDTVNVNFVYLDKQTNELKNVQSFKITKGDDFSKSRMPILPDASLGANNSKDLDQVYTERYWPYMDFQLKNITSDLTIQAYFTNSTVKEYVSIKYVYSFDGETESDVKTIDNIPVGTNLRNHIIDLEPNIDKKDGYIGYWDTKWNAINCVTENLVFKTIFTPVNTGVKKFIVKFHMENDGSVITMEIFQGHDVEELPVPQGLRFLDRVKYSINDLTDIQSDLDVVVTIDYTLKYVVTAIAGAAIIASFSTFVIVIVKLFTEDDEDQDEDDNVEQSEQQNGQPINQDI